MLLSPSRTWYPMNECTENASAPANVLRIQRQGDMCAIILNRPHALNAIDELLVEELERHLTMVAEDRRIRTVVLSGEGSSFCAGADVKAMLGRPDRSRLQGEELAAARATERTRLTRAFENVVRLLELPQPTVAALHGAVAGAGLALALACDFRVSAANVRMATAYGRLGLPGDWGLTYLLPHVIGTHQARRLLMRGMTIEADTARQLGMVDDVVPDDRLRSAAHSLADSLAEGPVMALGQMKALLRPLDLRSQLSREIEATLRCQETEEHAEGLRAFRARDTPTFRVS